MSINYQSGGTGPVAADLVAGVMGRKVKILVVDDEPGVRQVLINYLTGVGYEVDSAQDGGVAIEKLGKDSFDLVITDLKMPNMDGRALLQIMADRFPDTPKLVLTGYSTDEDIIHALKTGASDFITKPIMDFAILHHSVQKAISVKKLNDERNTFVEQLTQINSVISMLNRGMELDEIFKNLNITLRRIIPFNRLAMAVIDDSTGKVVTKLVESDRPLLIKPGDTQSLEESSLQGVAEKKEVLLIRDLEEYLYEHTVSKGAKLLLEEGMRSSMALPLIINNVTRGFLIFASVVPNFFREDHISFLRSVSGQISFSIQRAELLAELEVHSKKLEQLVKVRTFEVLKTQKTTIFALSKLAETRDSDTGEHLERMRKYCVLIAQILKYSGHEDEISNQYLRDLYDSSILHDIGKVGIPDNILMKPGPLTAEEFEIIKRHSVIGHNALKSASEELGQDSFLHMAMDVTLYHHERWDGLGYPVGLKGADIPLAARIVAIGDVYDALTTVRPYKGAYSHEEALKIMQDESSRYDPALFKIFLDNEAEFNRIRKEFE
ncbi:MAG: response regulator [Spirochaetes bacterium]|nr:response regulator [Spirochaetota bacterium]